MNWSAKQYSKFEDERNRPIRDLLAQVPNTRVATAADIGCGPGNSTELLQQQYPQAQIVGMDSSSDMIDAARKRLPQVTFEVDDIAAWRSGGGYDVILANAALQWVPDHAALLPMLLGKLAPGGSLAVQTPDNLDEPAHRLMRDVASDSAWAHKLTNASQSRESRRSAAWYYQLLTDRGADVNVWRTVYYHPLKGGAAAVVEWFKGSALRPFLAPLNDAERAAFLKRYEALIADAYPALADGTVILPFPRLFYVATR